MQHNRKCLLVPTSLHEIKHRQLLENSKLRHKACLLPADAGWGKGKGVFFSMSKCHGPISQ